MYRTASCVSVLTFSLKLPGSLAINNLLVLEKCSLAICMLSEPIAMRRSGVLSSASELLEVVIVETRAFVCIWANVLDNCSAIVDCIVLSGEYITAI